MAKSIIGEEMISTAMFMRKMRISLTIASLREVKILNSK